MPKKIKKQSKNFKGEKEEKDMLNIFLAAMAVGLMNNGKEVGVCGMELSKPYVVEASGVDLTDETRVESEDEDEEYAR